MRRWYAPFNFYPFSRHNLTWSIRFVLFRNLRAILYVWQHEVRRKFLLSWSTSSLRPGLSSILDVGMSTCRDVVVCTQRHEDTDLQMRICSLGQIYKVFRLLRVVQVTNLTYISMGNMYDHTCQKHGSLYQFPSLLQERTQGVPKSSQGQQSISLKTMLSSSFFPFLTKEEEVVLLLSHDMLKDSYTDQDCLNNDRDAEFFPLVSAFLLAGSPFPI